MSGATKGIRIQIENLLVDLWEDGYTIGQSEQWGEDKALLPDKLEDAYGDGYDKGFEQGQASVREVSK